MNAAKLAKTLARGKGSGAAFDPGVKLLDDKLAAAKVKQAQQEAEWKAKVASIDREWREGTSASVLGSQPSLLLDEGESFVDGVRIPKNLQGPTAVAYVVSQKKGEAAVCGVCCVCGVCGS